MAPGRRSEAKTALACDRCRHRKSRCDGRRPRCTHCTAAGIQCHYRPTATTLESEVSLLSRLDKIEARLQTLEEKEGPARGRHGHRSNETNGYQEASSFVVQADVTTAPRFHTASALQMIHSWPRLRLCFSSTSCTLEAFADADRQKPFTVQKTSGSRLSRLALAQRILVASGQHRCRMPLMLRLIQESHPDLRPDHIAELKLNDGSVDMSVEVEPDDFPPLQAMGIALAMATLEIEENSTGYPFIASEYLSSVLQRQWLLWNTVHERIALSIAIAYSLLRFWVRPYHALGALQGVKSLLARMRTRLQDHPKVAILSALYFMLESDLLGELDEYSTDTILSADEGAAITVELLQPFTTSKTTPETRIAGTESRSSYLYAHFDDIVWLRCHMNRILNLYTPNRAYARPHELADLVFGLGSRLREWYQRLPLERQFCRDIITFNLYERSLRYNLAQREIALRYFSCIFLLHRPVLYFFLHKDMEYAIQSPEVDGIAADHSPWVMESCRDCIESLALIIRLCHNQPDDPDRCDSQYWPECQLLFSAYLVLLQVRTYASLEPYLRAIGSVDGLLDMVEGEFRRYVHRSPILEESMKLLTTARNNLDATSPSQMN